ncbi:MAG TPA: guanylate kinase [Gemmatimonadales bacterium]
MTPFLLILSAPSGGGKTTIAKALLAARDDLGYSISATTRAPRSEERDGVDYFFIDDAAFDRRVAADEFIEWAEYGANRYGTLKSEVDRLQGMGQHVVLDIEVAGARQVRERCQNVVSVFIIPPSAQALVQRLGGRDTERHVDVIRRLSRAIEELREAPSYDYVVVNADKTEAVSQVATILDAEARRPARSAELTETLQTLGADLATHIAHMGGE